ncbi:MAG: mannonate dehydratase [Flavobacterium sp.]|jgi:mannonate dehydratase
MQQAWRWFGPSDPIPLDYIRQAGASHVVTSLHDIPTGEAWSETEIAFRKTAIEGENSAKSPLFWTVVESVNVHDDIKRAAPGHQQYVDNYCKTIEALGGQGINTICYNFMPLIDWTRTDLAYPLASGATCLRFDADQFAAFDLFLLRRENAMGDYSLDEIERAEQCYASLSLTEKEKLISTILSGLPGGTTGAHNVASFRLALMQYQDISSDQLRENLFNFLEQILPVAEAAGVYLAIHPDDPPRELLGLPRIMCNKLDIELLLAKQPSPANGLALCAGTYGVNADNDVALLASTFAERVYFAHLRGTRREENPLSFQEAEHLDSDVDMLSIITTLLAEEKRRKSSGHVLREIPIRPDHGHAMLDDLGKSATNPGYTAIGRLKGLAEIRGAIRAIEFIHNKT